MAKPAKSAASAASSATSAASRADALAKKAAASELRKRWEQRHEAVELDDSAPPKYVHDGPATKEELEENRKLYERMSESKTLRFLLKSEELTQRHREEEIRRYEAPLHSEEKKLWKNLPLIPGPHGEGKLVRLGLANHKDKAAGVFLDFFKNFHFGLWGYQQKQHPVQKPFDIQQVMGGKFLEKRYLDFTLRGSTWYYKDRLGRTRGPCEVVNLRTAWGAGIIDGNTFVWGDDMDEFAPIDAVYGLKAAIDTPDARLATAGTAFIHRLGFGKNPLHVRKGFEGSKKALDVRQKEALEDKERERNVMANNGGVWPGVRAPSHALFLWASGSELTKTLDSNGRKFPGKFIPYETRKILAERIPGLRPWEVVEVEQLFNLLTFRNDFWRNKLGTFSTAPDYTETHHEQTRDEWGEIKDALTGAFPELQR